MRIERKLAFDPHLQFATVSFELPGPQPAMGGQAQIDAGVTRSDLAASSGGWSVAK